MPSVNEPLVCQVVAWYFSAERGKPPVEIARPDQEHGNVSHMPKAVERIYRVGDGLLSVEHTLLESFVDQTFTDKRFRDVMEPVATALTGRLPAAGSYLISVPVDAFEGLKLKGYPSVQNEIIEWVQSAAPALSVDVESTGPAARVEVKLPKSGIAVSLVRRPTLPGRVLLARSVSEDLEASTLKRFQRALEDKSPKLEATKAQRGGESVLVLECVDIGLGGAGPATRSLKAVGPTVTCVLPDWILLVEPDRSGWSISVLRYPDGSSPKAYTETMEVPSRWLTDVVPAEATA